MNYRNQNKPPIVPIKFGKAKRLSLDDGSLEMNRNIGGRRMSTSTPRRQALSPMNMQKEVVVPFSENEGLECEKTYTKEEVDVLLKDKFKGNNIDWKRKQEWTIEYIRRMKVCVKWFQKALEDVVEEKDGLRKMLDLSESKCLEAETALKSKEEEFKVTVSKLEMHIISLNESLAKEESLKSDALDCQKKEKEAKMALEKRRDSLRKELGWAEQNVLNANEKLKMQEHMYARVQEYNSGLQKYNTRLQDELIEANHANKQLESEKAAILQELSTLRARYTLLQREFNAAKIDVSR
ncbi:Kinesin, motor domain-containing protein [Artemisia annua]|uniref:Kinesin, motor domain-containing protein n=1 Tax=Artemisia annua TaxID=35608 RepID=A0A2U1KQY9_ARTAN|nr:Kinesin, motor domain-containing protein [Artemisia annua]